MPTPTEPAVNDVLARKLGLSEQEWQAAARLLDGRKPTYPELGVLGVLWSEARSGKSSRVHLDHLPSGSPRVLKTPGPNAGAVDLGDGWAAICAMTAGDRAGGLDPYRGAAGCLGQTVSQVFALGARPLANLNALRFGDLDAPRTRELAQGVSAGLGSYGNCLGIPMLGGDVGFDPCRNGTVRVGTFTLGVMRTRPDSATEGGGKLIYIGAKTAATAGEEGRQPPPPADPFTGKLLLEACLEILQTGSVVAIQALGPAGLAGAAYDRAARTGSGVEYQLDQIPMAEEGMTPFELMRSASPERMLLEARPGSEPELQRILHKWGLAAVVVGQATDSRRLRGLWYGQQVIDLPLPALASAAPARDLPQARPAYLDAVTPLTLPEDLRPEEVDGQLRLLLASPACAGRGWFYDQYDGTVRGNTLLHQGEADAGLIRVEGTPKALALTCDGNSRLAWLDPFWGAAHAVAEACRNLACVGAEPIGLTHCLAYGDPEQPEAMWALAQTVLGIRQACLALEVPVLGGDVSADSATGTIHPAALVAALGLIEDCTPTGAGKPYCGSGFKAAGHGIFLLGESRDELGGSEYLRQRLGRVAGPCPELRLDQEFRLQACVREGIRMGLIRSAHDTSEGGLLVAVLESGFNGNLGCRLELMGQGLRLDALLFGESAGRIVITVEPEDEGSLARLAATHRVPLQKLGSTGGTRVVVAVDSTVLVDTGADALRRLHGSALEAAL